MLFDSHVHSKASPDSELEPESAIQACKKMNLGIAFTEHIDINNPESGFDPGASDKPLTTIDFIADETLYPTTYENLRGDGVLLGLEIGLTAYAMPLNREKALSYDYDFIIGSVHFVDGYDLYDDAKNVFDYDRKRRMLTYSYEMVEICDFIDAFGHIDFISRYTPASEKNVYYHEYAAEYDALLKILAERDIALEINTAGFGQIPGLEANLARVFKRFYELGGRYVTLGSDAHCAENLGRSFGSALAIAKEADLIPVYFKNRKRYKS
jgi:histidinol-phosphatase (PHP family)